MPDIVPTKLPPLESIRDNTNRVDKKSVKKAGMQNAAAVGEAWGNKYYVKNNYSGHLLRIDNTSITHGISGSELRIKTNSSIGSVIGDIVKNAIPINALKNTAKNVSGTYAMAAYAVDMDGREYIAIVTVEQRGEKVKEIETFDIVHSVNGRNKRGELVDSGPQGVNPSKLTSRKSIAEILGYVKETFQSILSDDVLRHFGETKNPDGYYTNRTLFSRSDRSHLHQVSTQEESQSQ